MHITKDQTIADVPILTVRSVIRLERLGWLARDSVDEALGERADDVLNALVSDGYLKPPVPCNTELDYELTTRGHALTMASTAPRIRRATAQKALDALLDKIDELHANPLVQARVERVELFGSMLDESVDRVGDVDLAVKVVRTGEMTRQEAGNSYQRMGRLPEPGQKWWEEDVMLCLRRLNKRVLSVTTYDQHIQLLSEVPHRQVYPRVSSET